MFSGGITLALHSVWLFYIDDYKIYSVSDGRKPYITGCSQVDFILRVMDLSKIVCGNTWVV